tara:strand:- start:225 stop:344 length:120 start_codon:yes stop_codon:yes gene_type:complete
MLYEKGVAILTFKIILKITLKNMVLENQTKYFAKTKKKL